MTIKEDTCIAGSDPISSWGRLADRTELAQDIVVWNEQSAAGRHLAGGREGHAPFPRRFAFNQLIAPLAGLLPVRDLKAADVRRWLDSSLAVFRDLVDDPDVLARIKTDTLWLTSSDPPPDDDVWSGECEFSEDEPPVARCYTRTIASRLPRTLFELAWQGAMDHFVGHLYPFYRGAASPAEYDESVACRYQYLAAKRRARSDRRFAIVALFIPPVYRLHKGIPLSNYPQ